MLKEDEVENIESFKERWVIKGNMQTDGVDFDLKYAPVSRLSILRKML